MDILLIDDPIQPSPGDSVLITKIATRFTDMMKAYQSRRRKHGDVRADLEKAHIHNPLRLEDLFQASDVEFIHDMTAILYYIDRESGKFRNCFTPKFAAPKPDSSERYKKPIVSQICSITGGPRFRIEGLHNDDGGLIIRDLGPWSEKPTVTNAAEAVVELLLNSGKLRPDQRLYYIDSEGQFDEIKIENGAFATFARCQA
jgi:hypothetical protein